MAKLTKHPPGYPVVFKNPTTGKAARGSIVDEVWALDPEEFDDVAIAHDGWREGAPVAQLIEWANGDKSVRITYYLRPHGGGADAWYFGGQFAATMDIDAYRSLLNKLKQRNW